MLLCDRKARQFIGRQFTLTDPQGKVVAKGAYIEVPADNPQSYRTSAGEVKSKTAVILSPSLLSWPSEGPSMTESCLNSRSAPRFPTP